MTMHEYYTSKAKRGHHKVVKNDTQQNMVYQLNTRYLPEDLIAKPFGNDEVRVECKYCGMSA